MKVLIINCGSSSLKYQLIDSSTEAVLAVGLCERIGIDGRFNYTPAGKDKIVIESIMQTHNEAIKMVLDALVNENYGVIKDLSEIKAVGHRVVHGGEKFASSVIINDEVLKAIEDCNELAPLHNPANIIGINACSSIMPGVPQVAVFDTAFHQTMPAKAFMYGLPYEYYDEFKVRKYGFHGTSHSYVSKETAKFLNIDINNSKIVVCHIGNGASISAVLNGKSIDTSMGLTPLEGLIMGTRSGSIDPAIIEFIANKKNLSISQVMNILNKESGLKGVSGTTSDIRDITAAVEANNPKAIIAFEMLGYQIAKYIGSYAAALNGLDAISFTAGIGENVGELRQMVCDYLGFLGIKIDPEQNSKRKQSLVISTPDSKVKVCVIPTNEELAICRETVNLVK